MTKYVLKKMAKIHCARGPKRCNKCAENSKDIKWALLDVAPEENPMAARPMIELEVEGEMVFLPYDVINYWDDLMDALDYVEAKGLKVHVIDEA